MSVVLMAIVDEGRRMETHGGVGIFRIILVVQVESACLAVFSLLYTDLIWYLMIEYVVSHTILFFRNQLSLISIRVFTKSNIG